MRVGIFFIIKANDVQSNCILTQKMTEFRAISPMRSPLKTQNRGISPIRVSPFSRQQVPMSPIRARKF